MREAESIPTSVDLLIVGGGIYGAWTAFLAARAGLSTLLVEQGDWGSGTSCCSSKLIHGGLRYLEYGDLRLVHKALQERRILSKMAPHWVRPLRFVSPIWEDHRYAPWKMSLGLSLYDALAGRQQPVRRHTRHKSAALLQTAPFLEPQGLRAGFSYGDCGTDDARLVWTLVASARIEGAVCRSQVEALEPWWREGRCCGARLREGSSGDEFTCKARDVIYANGPWIGGLENDLPAPRVRMTKGVHLVMPAMPTGKPIGLPDLLPDGRHAFLLTAPSDRRVFFLIPWYGRTLLGTTDTEEKGNPSTAEVTEADRRYLLTAANARCPGLNWSDASILGSFAGLRTMQAGDADDPGALTREWEARDIAPGCTVYVGGKLTSARADAASVVRRLLKTPHPPGWDTSPLPLTLSAEECAKLSADYPLVEPECMTHWLARYGSRTRCLIELAREEEGFDRIVPDLPFRHAEISFARKVEDVNREDDLFRRRVPLSILGGPGWQSNLRESS